MALSGGAANQEGRLIHSTRCRCITARNCCSPPDEVSTAGTEPRPSCVRWSNPWIAAHGTSTRTRQGIRELRTPCARRRREDSNRQTDRARRASFPHRSCRSPSAGSKAKGHAGVGNRPATARAPCDDGHRRVRGRPIAAARGHVKLGLSAGAVGIDTGDGRSVREARPPRGGRITAVRVRATTPPRSPRRAPGAVHGAGPRSPPPRPRRRSRRPHGSGPSRHSTTCRPRR